MSVVVIGLNHRIAPLALLERMNVEDGRLPKSLADLCARPNITEAVVLSTCNRTEVYVAAERYHGAYADVCDFLADLSALPPDEFAPHLYSHFDEGAADHLFGVAAGLDSAVLGETEIVGQVRTAWDVAQAEGSARSTLNALFRHALEAGKRVRTETAISRGTTSVSQAAVAMAAERLGGLDGKRVLVFGAGEMGEGMAVALGRAGVADIAVANRTHERAEALADRVGGRAVRVADVAAALTEADLLLTSTGSTSIILEQADLAPVMAKRPRRPLLVVDVAVPRDVDPAVAYMPGVTLLDIDDLRVYADAALQERQREVPGARSIIEAEVQRWVDHATAREVAPLVAALHEHGESIRSRELERFRGRLDRLGDDEREIVEALSRGIVAKLLHEPTMRIKDVAGTPRAERLAEALRDLFSL